MQAVDYLGGYLEHRRKTPIGIQVRAAWLVKIIRLLWGLGTCPKRYCSPQQKSLIENRTTKKAVAIKETKEWISCTMWDSGIIAGMTTIASETTRSATAVAPTFAMATILLMVEWIVKQLQMLKEKQSQIARGVTTPLNYVLYAFHSFKTFEIKWEFIESC